MSFLIQEANKILKEKEYCYRCGALCVKELCQISTFFDSKTGKSEKTAKVKIFCPNRGFLSQILRFSALHRNILLPDDGEEI